MDKRRSSGEKDITLGLDLGSSVIKAVAVDRTGDLLGFLKAEASTAGRNAALATAKRLADEFEFAWSRVSGVSITGVGGQRVGKTLGGVAVRRVGEFSAIGRGALALAGVEAALVASMGTGTAFVRADSGGAAHLGGTGVGGGAIMGICRSLYGLTRFPDIMTIAEKGDLSRVDLRVGDIAGATYSGLDPKLTSANFGKLEAGVSREDFIAGLVNMVLETIGVMAVMTCKAGGLDTVVLVGALTIMPQVLPVFARFEKTSGIRFVVPENSTYAIAAGAALA